MPITPLAAGALLSATLAIAGAPWALDRPWLHVVFKPLTTGLIIAHAMAPDDFGEEVIIAAFEGLAGPKAQ